jgi:hypothetical protein
LTSALDGSEWSASRLGRFNPRERVPGHHWIGGWMGPRAVLDAVVKRKIIIIIIIIIIKLFFYGRSVNSKQRRTMKIKDNLQYFLEAKIPSEKTI